MHYAVGSDAIHGPGGNAWVCSVKLALMAFSLAASPAFLEGHSCSQALLPFPPKTGRLPGPEPFAAAPAKYRLPALAAAHPGCGRSPKHQSLFALPKPSCFARDFAVGSEEPAVRFPRSKPPRTLLPQQPGGASRGTRHPLGSRCPSKRHLEDEPDSLPLRHGHCARLD